MKRYVIILFVLIFIMLIQGFRVYHGMRDEHRQAEAAAVEQALHETNLKHADQVDYFTGPKAYFVIRGTSEDRRKMFVFVNEKGKERPFSIYSRTIASEGEIRDSLKREAPGAEVLRITPGRLNSQFVWEALLKDDHSGRLAYHYYKLQTGKFVKSIALTS